MTDNDPVLASISPSAPRRLMGVTTLCVLGGLLLYLALTNPPSDLGWRLFLFGFGGAALALAEGVRRATENRIELTEHELRDSSGRVMARIDQIVAVERGTFAIKPSNGFLLRLKSSPEGGGHWAPGLWWRLGRRVGVGGITSASEAKTVAEYIAALLVRQYQEAAGDQDAD